MTADIVIRVDGGSQIGYGHLVRSLALAAELSSAGYTVTVATATPAPARKIFPAGMKIITLPARDDPKPFVAWIDRTSPDAVFTDCHVVDTAYQRAVRERVPLAVLQDDLRYVVCADLIVNRNIYTPSLSYDCVGAPQNVSRN